MTVVDIHTHMYPPAYMELLRARTQVPYVKTTDHGERLIILPNEDTGSTASGRPIGREYHSAEAKMSFMDAHGIDVSVVSLANPWLDWLPADTAAVTARKINDDMEYTCAQSGGRLYAFGTLPLSAPKDDIVSEIERLKTLPHMRGVVMGTSGVGQGLDDPALDIVWETLERTGTLLFLHPHYGLPSSVYGPRASDYGHVLSLALGFPLETTIAITRMLLSGIWDRFPRLELLIAHSGGTLPFLAGRIESCIAHDAQFARKATTKSRRDIWDVLKSNIYLDAVIYADVGLRAALNCVGSDRLMFGTDHPFFPPLDEHDEQWGSVTLNSEAVKTALSSDDEAVRQIMGGNALRVLRLKQ